MLDSWHVISCRAHFSIILVVDLHSIVNFVCLCCCCGVC